MADEDTWAAPSPTFGPAQASAQPGAGYAAPPTQPGYSGSGEVPYGSMPPPYDGEPSDKNNWMGITSLIMGVIGLSLIGIIFGHMGLRAANNGTANNRGIALAGTIVSWLATLFVTGLLVVAIVAAANDTSDSAGAGPVIDDASERDDVAAAEDDAAVADDTVGVFTAEEANSYLELYYGDSTDVGTCLGQAASVRWDLVAVDCDQPHVAEIFLAEPVGPFAGADDPASDEVQGRVAEACDRAYAAYVGVAYEKSAYLWWYFAATNDVDVDATDTYLCVVSLDFTELDGVIQGSGR